MTCVELRQLLNWMMVSDSWPDGVDQNILEDMLDREAKVYGFKSWVEAYHQLKDPAETSVSEAANQGFNTLYTDKSRPLPGQSTG